MGQSKKGSLIEVCVNTAIGYSVALLSQRIIFPLFGIELNAGENALMALVFTSISLIRGYMVRRTFNHFGWFTKYE